MNIVKLLVKAQYTGFKLSSFLNTSFKNPNKKTKPIFKVLGTVLIIIGLVIATSSFIFIFYSNFSGINLMVQYLMNRPDGGIISSLLMSFIIVLLFSFIYSNQILYKGKDLKLLQTLPISSKQLISSRLVVLYLDLLPFHLFVVLPALVNIFIVNSFYKSFIFGTIIILFLFQLLPMALGNLISMLVIRFGKKGADKTNLEIMVVSMIMLAILILQTRISEKMIPISNSLMTGKIEVDVISMITGIFESLYHYCFYMVWAGSSLFDIYAISSIPKYLVFTVVCILLIYLIIDKSYLKCLSLNSSTAVKKQNSKTLNVKASNSIVKSLLLREWEILKSSSYFIFEIMGEALIPLILIIVYSFMGVLTEIMDNINYVQSFPYFPVLVCAALAFMGSLSQVSSTSISREGNQFIYNKCLPIQAFDYFKAKVYFHLILMFIPNVIFTIAALTFFSFPFYNLFWMIGINFLLILNSSYIGLFIDSQKPFLNWTSPQQAVKQNFNGIKGVGITFVFFVLNCGLFYIIDLLSYDFAIIVVYIFLLAVTPFIRKQAIKKMEELYSISSDFYI